MSTWVPIVVQSRSELERLLREHPMQLRAHRLGTIRVGHPDFIGPVHPEYLASPGILRFETDGSAYFELVRDVPPYHAWKGAKPSR